jgi:hypothetical protein
MRGGVHSISLGWKSALDSFHYQSDLANITEEDQNATDRACALCEEFRD